ncbi:U2 snRNP complex subunit YSF3 [Saccharomyces cerevisiae S288C]|uniref:RDS3 complex subunit 10 n=2 Tax=Saccharomyces cerevisiae TaxID=4932 RepID=YSF3_YEAST|nr:U2 snRNP complex subunit YSF3 [Saccharomyces cerevisiae S288C]P0C074.1 RecName: Full=RDS3 complex subunit 10; AltName: Full=Splicing factor 3b subunit [Saccharomyces cerevisiae S288C]5GM6_K Chain K, RDS3 complex subunit 10 [Saccharomyces cerevisiae S288C]5LQW_Z Chain Z, RDS3 complex subunit 10 [Saccharomyces cerevisiae]5NRL_Z Chain Z, RDS3 complex subunit 10 [Saccharomyces cerevisiae]5ZWM_6 Chain 6, RDS3 complex subunit 10 [Saccharomyces cerevisiae S288C]5ZWO_6 Chain 6, RDS3 complex subuni|eukprot:NP_878153.1 U2 snRNP complex subunit YSF3 [Saccharomyces cerevisiae S288C]
MAEKQRQLKLQKIYKQKYIGLGDESTTREQWQRNVRNDTLNTLQGHSASLEYVSLSRGDLSIRDTRIHLLKSMSPGYKAYLREER